MSRDISRSIDSATFNDVGSNPSAAFGCVKKDTLACTPFNLLLCIPRLGRHLSSKHETRQEEAFILGDQELEDQRSYWVVWTIIRKVLHSAGNHVQCQ